MSSPLREMHTFSGKQIKNEKNQKPAYFYLSPLQRQSLLRQCSCLIDTVILYSIYRAFLMEDILTCCSQKSAGVNNENE